MNIYQQTACTKGACVFAYACVCASVSVPGTLSYIEKIICVFVPFLPKTVD